MKLMELAKKWWLIGAAVLGVALILLPRFLPGGEGKEKTASEPKSSDPSYYSTILEEKIKTLILRIEGIEDAAVLLTMDGSSEFVYAQNTSVSSDGRTGDYLVVQEEGGEKTVLVNEIYPQIRGVAIVCTDGDNVQIQKKVTDLISASLGISSSRITVAG
ncbi:MAG: hypothetical protein HFE66_06520 [Clostridiales bacterium]|jgi:stage III sporulation protein AG|nr:hypothetical protein [Clostridiales bacterium]